MYATPSVFNRKASFALPCTAARGLLAGFSCARAAREDVDVQGGAAAAQTASAQTIASEAVRRSKPGMKIFPCPCGLQRFTPRRKTLSILSATPASVNRFYVSFFCHLYPLELTRAHAPLSLTRQPMSPV